MTGLSEDDRVGFGPGVASADFPRYFRTQSYCSHPRRGYSRSTDFHFGCPFRTSHGMLSAMSLANLPTLSQSRRRKSKEIRTDFTATVSTALGCQGYVLAGISARG